MYYWTNIGVITVPDDRLEFLSKIRIQKVITTTVEIVDIAGLVKGASKGERLAISKYQRNKAIIHVLRCFEDNNIVHVDGTVNPVRDKETIDIELQLKDLSHLRS